MSNMNDMIDLSELEKLVSYNEKDIDKLEDVVLSQNLEGFASCFPEWDLHPPIKR